MRGGDLRLADLASELRQACEERRARRREGDAETAELLTAWIDTLLDEWNRRAGPPPT